MSAPAPILIAGTGRCGTSVLAAMMMESPNVFPYMEPEPLYDLFMRWLARRVPAPGFRRSYAAKVSSYLAGDSTRWYRALAGDGFVEAFTPEAVLAAWDTAFGQCRTRADCTRSFATFTERLLGDFARARGRRRWCVKQPGHLYENIDVVFRLHPDARFIHIVRDGRDVVASIFSQPWNTGSIDRRFRHALDLWSTTLRKGLAREGRTPADQRLEVRFEDLATDPAGVIERVFGFAGERTGLPESYFAPNGEWSGNNFSRHRTNVGRYREILSEPQIARIEDEYGDVLEYYGYAKECAKGRAKECAKGHAKGHAGAPT